MLAEAAAAVAGVEVVHLEGLYPEERIDLDAEVARLRDFAWAAWGGTAGPFTLTVVLPPTPAALTRP